MSLEESQARLEASRTEIIYQRFDGKDLVHLMEEIEEHGVENIDLHVYPGLNKDGYPDLHLQMFPKDGTKDCGIPTNCSHPCPPFCNKDGESAPMLDPSSDQYPPCE